MKSTFKILISTILLSILLGCSAITDDGETVKRVMYIFSLNEDSQSYTLERYRLIYPDSDDIELNPTYDRNIHLIEEYDEVTSKEVVMPSDFNGLPVTEIGGKAFSISNHKKWSSKY